MLANEFPVLKRWEKTFVALLYVITYLCITWLLSIFFLRVSHLFLALCLLDLQKQPLEMFLEQSQNSHENTCVGVSFIKIAGPRPATILKKRLQQKCFPVDFVKFLRTSCSQNTSRWLLLDLQKKIGHLCILLGN